MSAFNGLGRVLTRSLLGAAMVLATGTFAAPSDALAQDAMEPVSISASAIGRPPIFSNIFVDVGQAKGYWEEVGADVDFRWFQRGSDTAKTVVTGDVAIGFTSSQAGLNLIASGAPVVAVAAMPNQDWIIGSNDPDVQGCEDLAGKTVTADGINNARYLFLASAVKAACGLDLEDMTLIDLANAPLVKAGIAGQVHSGVFHIDELAQVEGQIGEDWILIDVPPEVKEKLHYAMADVEHRSGGPEGLRRDRQRRQRGRCRRQPVGNRGLSGDRLLGEQ